MTLISGIFCLITSFGSEIMTCWHFLPDYIIWVKDNDFLASFACHHAC